MRFLLLTTVVACTPRVQLEPNRAGCTEVYEGDFGADGTVEFLRTSVRNDDEQIVSVQTSYEGAYDYEYTATYDGDCQTSFISRQVFDNGDIQDQEYTRTCDDNADPLTETDFYSYTGSQDFERTIDRAWDRVYDEAGRSGFAELIEDYGNFLSEATIRYRHDALGRRTLEFTDSDFYVRHITQLWNDELKSEDLRDSAETRDAFGQLIAATYATYDERGRATIVRTLNDDRVERIRETVWEDKRPVPVSFVERVDGEVSQEATVEADDEKAWMTQTVQYDGYDGLPDGTVDYAETITWTCP